jgi:hypothetical protein
VELALATGVQWFRLLFRIHRDDRAAVSRNAIQIQRHQSGAAERGKVLSAMFVFFFFFLFLLFVSFFLAAFNSASRCWQLLLFLGNERARHHLPFRADFVPVDFLSATLHKGDVVFRLNLGHGANTI